MAHVIEHSWNDILILGLAEMKMKKVQNILVFVVDGELAAVKFV